MIGTLVTIVHLFICVFLILIVLLQQGKGADVGATFGGGGNTMFGASGADTFLTKVTTFVAICFMLTSVVLAVRGQSGGDSSGTLFQNLPETQSLPTANDLPVTESPATGSPEAGSPEAGAPVVPSERTAEAPEANQAAASTADASTADEAGAGVAVEQVEAASEAAEVESVEVVPLPEEQPQAN